MHRRDVIRGKIWDLEEKFEEERRLNKAGWEMYGSEWCSGDMARREEDIQSQIRCLEALLAMPEVDMDKETLDQEEGKTFERISSIEAEEARLSEEKKELKDRMTNIRNIQDIPLIA